MERRNRSGSCILALLWLYFLSVVSFSPNYRVHHHPISKITSRSIRRHFGGELSGVTDERCEQNLEHGKDRPPIQRQLCQVWKNQRLSLRTKISPLFAVPSTDTPPAENRSGIIRRSLRKLFFFPLRLLIFKPIRYLMELLVDEVDLDDGTTIMAQPLEEAPDEEVSVVFRDGKSIKLSSVTVRDENLEAQEGGPTIAARLAPPQKSTVKPNKLSSRSKPVGTRWAVAAPDVDLTGDWEVIVTDEFKKEYDQYLTELGQPMLVRSVALGIISLTTEVTKQTDNGKALLIRGKNVRGIWDRTLVSSGSEIGMDEFTPLVVPVMSADSEEVEAESWWEADGHVHVSWLRGVKKYGGGAFESRRYLDGDTYVCGSTFHPEDISKPSHKIVWRFQRQTATE